MPSHSLTSQPLPLDCTIPREGKDHIFSQKFDLAPRLAIPPSVAILLLLLVAMLCCSIYFTILCFSCTHVVVVASIFHKVLKVRREGHKKARNVCLLTIFINC